MLTCYKWSKSDTEYINVPHMAPQKNYLIRVGAGVGGGEWNNFSECVH